jgi:hypothetical protein
MHADLYRPTGLRRIVAVNSVREARDFNRMKNRAAQPAAPLSLEKTRA